ncbi:hypothetical protein FOZG_18414 [Fusarium oxysporum Fo47]|uniref:DUF659 domain-containing protein n=1 Tax=Fusarium oxysporum Fo47 TaxID=660027 RepID=W9JBP6_FUSOX|nr:hypothetical protein FOZG_18414 [Fusarium oxysporum Fo47]
MADYQPDSRPPTLERSAQVKSTAAIPERTEEDEKRLFRLFRGWTLSERDGQTRQWVYRFGYDIQNIATKERRWVCCLCIKRKDPRPNNYNYKGLQNAKGHLFKDHNGIVDPSGKRQALKSTVATPARSVATLLRLDPEVPRDQEITNLLIKRFNKAAFQQMIVNRIVNTNRSFTTAKDPDLRAIFEYLNPSVSITEAHISDVASPGQIHIQFDGWRSGNRHALYGVTCIFRNLDNRPQKCVLGLPELLDRHTGENIAEQILNIVREFQIGDKLGCFTLDNASNNKTTMEELDRELGFAWKKRWVRCIGHVINRVVKHMLFGQDPDAFEQQIYDGQFTAAREHEQWRKGGLVGKWHNFAVEVNRSGIWTNTLKKVQQVESQLSNDPAIQNHGPVGVVLDNATRWLSQLAMVDRTLVLQLFYDPFIQRALSEWNKANLTRSGSVRKGARMPFFLKDENRISSSDWRVLQALRDILLDFQLVVKALEGDGLGKHQKQGQEDEVEPPLSGWIKLYEYYQYLNDSPVIYGAAALHPAYRWALFEDLWGDDAKRRTWIIKAKAIIQDLWECEYKGLFSEDQDSDLPASKDLNPR